MHTYNVVLFRIDPESHDILECLSAHEVESTSYEDAYKEVYVNMGLEDEGIPLTLELYPDGTLPMMSHQGPDWEIRVWHKCCTFP